MALGQPERGIDELRTALDGIRQLGHLLTVWRACWALGTALAQAGKDDEAARGRGGGRQHDAQLRSHLGPRCGAGRS
jgi:hypothetical protein